jgi:hypothetical protein
VVAEEIKTLPVGYPLTSTSIEDGISILIYPLIGI